MVAFLFMSLIAQYVRTSNRDYRAALAKATQQAAAQAAKSGSNIKTTAPAPDLPGPADMNVWMPAILALFGSLIVVVLTSWVNTKALSGQIDALRAEVKQGFAELRLEFHQKSDSLDRRVSRLENERLIK